jgi:hypothetical protein
MPTLIKIYDETCDVCKALEGSDSDLAKESGMGFEQTTLDELGGSLGALKDYVISYHVSATDGMIDIPVYIIMSEEGYIQASGVVKDLEELENLITAYQQWAASQSAKSAS